MVQILPDPCDSDNQTGKSGCVDPVPLSGMINKLVPDQLKAGIDILILGINPVASSRFSLPPLHLPRN